MNTKQVTFFVYINEDSKEVKIFEVDLKSPDSLKLVAKSQNMSREEVESKMGLIASLYKVLVEEVRFVLSPTVGDYLDFDKERLTGCVSKMYKNYELLKFNNLVPKELDKDTLYSFIQDTYHNEVNVTSTDDVSLNKNRLPLDILIKLNVEGGKLKFSEDINVTEGNYVYTTLFGTLVYMDDSGGLYDLAMVDDIIKAKKIHNTLQEELTMAIITDMYIVPEDWIEGGYTSHRLIVGETYIEDREGEDYCTLMLTDADTSRCIYSKLNGEAYPTEEQFKELIEELAVSSSSKYNIKYEVEFTKGYLYTGYSASALSSEYVNSVKLVK